MIKEYENKDWLYQRYIEEKLSTTEIGEICGVAGDTIRWWLVKFDIPRRTISEAVGLWHEARPGIVKGKNHPCWRGGKTVDRGYAYIHQPNHPYANNAGYVFEHRLIAEKALRRYLKPNEVVHHINGDKLDNRNKNFLICTKSYHAWLNNRMTQLYQQEHFGV